MYLMISFLKHDVFVVITVVAIKNNFSECERNRPLLTLSRGSATDT